MVQFNLLPDVKIEYIKTRYRKRLMMLISAVASIVCLSIFILLFLFVKVNQAKHLRDLDKDIKATVSEIRETPDIDKILTIQNQLDSLPELHDKEIVASRLVDYLSQLTPNDATISEVNIDFELNTLNIKGNSSTLMTVNKYVDTIKFTDYKVNVEGGASAKAFKNVVLQTYSVARPGDTGGSAYAITFEFDPIIFAQHKDSTATQPVSLTVPKIISTRSETEKPKELFMAQPDSPQEEGAE